MISKFMLLVVNNHQQHTQIYIFVYVQCVPKIHIYTYLYMYSVFQKYTYIHICICTVFQKSDAKIEITITVTNLIRIKYPLRSFNYHLSGANVANFNNIHCTVFEQQLFKNGTQKQKFPIWKSRLSSLYAIPSVTVVLKVVAICTDICMSLV